jgi:hypothetical protein
MKWKRHGTYHWNKQITWCHHLMITNKVHIIISLPLTLELIMTASHAHRSCVCLMLCLWQWLGQWICHVQVSVHLAYLHISSFNDLSDQVIAPQYMLGFLVQPWLLCLCNSTIIVTIEVYWTGATRDHAQLRNKFSDPYSFLRSFWSCNILGFYCWICDRLLLGTFLTHRPTIEADDIC